MTYSKTATLLLALFAQVRVEPEALSRAHVGQRIVLEDLCTSILGEAGAEHFRMKRCSNVKFIPENVSTERIKGINLEVTGTVKLRENDLIVLVDAIKRLPDDVTRYTQKAENIAPDDAASWYELANWARNRGEKYGSEEMLAKSLAAYTVAVAAERRLAAGNPVRLQQLRKRIETEKRLPGYDLNSLDHEILRAEAAQVDLNDAAALRQLANKVGQALQATPQLAPVSTIRREQYDAQPLAVYDQSESNDRKRLARYWQASLLNEALQLNRGNVDSTELAAAAARELPDYPDLVDSWQKRAVADFQRVPHQFSPAQVEELARKESKPEDVYLHWLKAREKRLVEEELAADRAAQAQGRRSLRDAKARFELAQFYGKWLPNNAVARHDRRRLLQETLQIDPQFAEADVQLRQLGEQRPATPAPQTAGGVGTSFRIGMRADEIPVAPDFKARVVTKDKIVHQWIYRGVAGGKNTYVFLEETAGGLTVSDVHNR